MNSKHDTVTKLLPKTRMPELDKDDLPSVASRSAKLINIGSALAAALLIAFVLLPRYPLLNAGDTASRTITAPYTIFIERSEKGETGHILKVDKGDVIVGAGQTVSEDAALILKKIANREGIGNKQKAFFGLTLLLLILFYLFYRDIKRYRPALITDTRKIFLLAFLLSITVLVSHFSKSILSLVADKFNLDPVMIGFAIPVSAGAMLVCLLLDFHLALGFSFVVSILMGILFQGDALMPVYYFLGSITAALAVIHCKKRTAVIRAGAFVGLVNLITIIGIDMYRGKTLIEGGYDLSAGFLGALLIAMIVSVSLPFFEAVFDIATDIKLLELLDPNQPLLKELVYKSPGTYHHSIVIGNLAEAAAEAIGENPLLARVGAYYHDVGKIRKPEYFIENQRPSQNKHDRLMPSMSSLIIASHVKDGVDSAREHGLPSSIIDIIRQHHGTSLITYFYQKAKELQPLVKISEEDYRYPGPRPRTKIAAIIMLSDSVEAASRTLENPTSERIQALTHSIITRIFLDDQLVKCDLTLKDLREIARSFNFVLSGIFHHRIDYPGMELSAEKRRREHQDKKHAEEAGAGQSGDREKDGEPLEEHWPS